MFRHMPIGVPSSRQAVGASITSFVDSSAEVKYIIRTEVLYPLEALMKIRQSG